MEAEEGGMGAGIGAGARRNVSRSRTQRKTEWESEPEPEEDGIGVGAGGTRRTCHERAGKQRSANDDEEGKYMRSGKKRGDEEIPQS